MSFREWKEVRLGDVADFQKGFAFKSKDFQNKGVKIVKVSNLTDDSIDKLSCVAFDEENAKVYENYNLQANDIIITTVGSWPTNPASVVGKVVRVPSDLNNSLLNQNAVRVRAKNTVYQNYLYYLLKNKVFGEYIVGTAQGSANQASITQVDIKSFEFALPVLGEQKSIGCLLRSFDDKIQLNSKINKNLEEMAQAIFKRWFIDFEFPNENGEPYKSSGGEMVESEIGLIPKGWKVCNLGDLVDSVSKKHKFPDDKIIFLNTSDILAGEILHNNYSEVSSLPGQAKKSMAKNDILYSEIRPQNKRFAYVDFEAEEYVVSTKLMVLRASANVDPIIIYYFLTSDSIINYLQVLAEFRSGTFPQITFSELKTLSMAIPPEGLLKQSAQILRAIFANIQHHKRENNKLSTIRDTLLPKLMSGEIRVPLDK